MRAVRGVAVITAIFLAGCSNAYLVKPVRVPPELKAVVLEAPDGWTLNKIALIEMEGIIRQGRSAALDDPVTLLRKELDIAERDSGVKAVILRMDSPGGSAAASDIAYEQVMRFKRRSGKPVVAHITGVGASGAYYVALAADEIYATPGAITGSIGVVMQLFNIEGLLKKIGVEAETIKTGERKDMGSPFRELTDEDKEIFQEVLDSFHARFVDLVAERRGDLSQEEAGVLADGRIYTAAQAVSHGLIDGEGYADEVFARAKELSRIKKAKIVGFRKPFAGGGFGLAGTELNLLKVDLPGADLSPGIYYLWLPGKGGFQTQ